jgi:GntR family transcriptional regulator, transcriptional repressor for pyruvate dehydrogenase complex
MSFQKLEYLTAVETTALKIKEEIVKGNLNEGEKLPPERELAETFGVGRSTVREALQMLKIMGLLTVKGGGKGGAFVKSTNITSVINMIQLMLELEISNWKEVLEVRMAVEPFTNSLAAVNRTDEDLKNLENILNTSKESFDDYSMYASCNTDFHLSLAECSHNKLLTSLVHAIGGLIAKNGKELIVSPKHFPLVDNDHTLIYLAIKDRDQQAAYNLTKQHLIFAEEEYIKLFSTISGVDN